MTMPNMTAISRAAIDGSTRMSAHAFSGGGGYQGSSPSILSDPDAYRRRCDGPGTHRSKHRGRATSGREVGYHAALRDRFFVTRRRPRDHSFSIFATIDAFFRPRIRCPRSRALPGPRWSCTSFVTSIRDVCSAFMGCCSFTQHGLTPIGYKMAHMSVQCHNNGIVNFILRE